MEDIEKNEVDIHKLFQWGNQFELVKDVDGSTVPVFVRLVGDADWNKARVKALRASAELRRKLRDTNSDEYFAFLPDYESVDKNRLVDLNLAINIRNLTDKIISGLSLKVPVEPKSDSTLEQQEEYQKEIDAYPGKRKEIIDARLKVEMEKERKKYNKLSKEELEKEYTATLVNSMCELEMGKVFYDVCTFYGSFKDSKYTERLFKDLDDYLNSATYTKEQLVGFYRTLELGVSELKK